MNLAKAFQNKPVPKKKAAPQIWLHAQLGEKIILAWMNGARTLAVVTDVQTEPSDGPQGTTRPTIKKVTVSYVDPQHVMLAKNATSKGTIYGLHLLEYRANIPKGEGKTKSTIDNHADWKLTTSGGDISFTNLYKEQTENYVVGGDNAVTRKKEAPQRKTVTAKKTAAKDRKPSTNKTVAKTKRKQKPQATLLSQMAALVTDYGITAVVKEAGRLAVDALTQAEDDDEDDTTTESGEEDN